MIKQSGKHWDEGLRVGTPTMKADHVIATDYSRFGYGGDAWDKRASADAARRRFRVVVTPGAKMLVYGVLAALSFVAVLVS